MKDDTSTKPTSKIRVLAGIAGAWVAVIAIAALVYTSTTPPSPEEAAELYIESHYDAVAEAVVQTAFPDNPLTAEVIAEVAESIAEQVIPYRCKVNNDYATRVETRCNLSFSLDRPLELQIYAPFQVTMATTDRDFLGRSTPVVQDANPIINEMTVNGVSLDELTGAINKVQGVKETLDNLGAKILNLPTEVIPTGQPSKTTTNRLIETLDLNKQPPPTDLPREISESGICGRTPEIQEKLIEILQIPSCQVINAAELYRVRKLKASAQSFKVGDFDHLPNLKVLELGLNKDDKARPVELGAGIFKDLQSLTSMEINNDTELTIRLNKNTFKGLNNLKVLDIDYVENLPEEALDHLQQLEQLRISSIKGGIPSRALDKLQNAESIYIGTHSNLRTIPTDFLKNLQKLRRVVIGSKHMPTSMEVNSYETACEIEEWGLQDKEGNRIPMTVDSKIVEVTDRITDHDPINDRDVRICQFNVGGTDTKKIIIPLE